MFDPDLIPAKHDILRAAANHIFTRKSSAPRVLDAALAFMKRRYPQLWLSQEGLDFVNAVREAESSELYGETDKMRAKLAEIAAGHGLEMTFDHMGFRD